MASKVIAVSGVAASGVAENLGSTQRSAEVDGVGVAALAAAQPLAIAQSLAAIAGVQSVGAVGTIAAGAAASLAPPHDITTDVATSYALTTKYGWVGDEILLSWQQAGEVYDFEIECEHVENRIVQRFASNVAQLAWTPDRAGHWRVRVRSRLVDEVSAWASSDESGWWLFVWLKPPGFP